jgi:predicted RNA binding protein YcfA (HicA-like mRNA interferase family)
MSLRLRQLSRRDVAAALVRFGFEVVATHGSHCKMRRTLPSGERQILTIPLHPSLATGTLHAIYRQACRFVPETDLQSHFYSGVPSKRTPHPERPQPEVTRDAKRKKDKQRGRESRRGRR